MKLNRKEDAVSPVIGVMLMLVVTIIIAAVITGFATDLSADTSSTPMALMEIDYVEMNGGYVKSFGFAHKGGDAVPLKDIQISYTPDDTESMGFLNIVESSQISVIGKSGSDIMITTGDIIKVVPMTDDFSRISQGSGVAWTISHTKTGGVIAKGEFIALPM